MNIYDKSRSYSSRDEWKDNGNGNFANVYFRIDTIGFDCISGYFAEDNDRIAQTWTFEEALKIATKILDEWANNNLDNYNI